MTKSSVVQAVDFAPPTSPEAVLANADAAGDLIAAEADASDRDGRLTPALAEAFRAAGFFEMGFPRRLGGLEMTLADQVTVVAKLARADAGAAWNVGVLNATGFYASRLADDVYAELYPSRDTPTSGSFHPRGRADRVDGGYLVSGRWDWGSGSYVAEHIIGGCLVFDADEPVMAPSGRQLVLGIWLPRHAVVHLDNWQVLGQRASGSSSYVIEEPVFVPEGHAFDREALPNPDADPLNKHVTLVFFPLTGVCVGVAQRALDLALAAVQRRAAAGGGAARDTATRRLLGQAVAEVDSMFASVTDVARRTDEIIFTPRRILSPLEEMRLAVLNLMAAESLRRVMDACVELYGSHYVFDDDPMQRVVRDVQTALAHVGAKRIHWQHVAQAVLDDADAPVTLFDVPWRSTTP
jgi:alkylation response protein AidB-like acyl-CoA dehydrogenase